MRYQTFGHDILKTSNSFGAWHKGFDRCRMVDFGGQ